MTGARPADASPSVATDLRTVIPPCLAWVKHPSRTARAFTVLEGEERPAFMQPARRAAHPPQWSAGTQVTSSTGDADGACVLAVAIPRAVLFRDVAVYLRQQFLPAAAVDLKRWVDLRLLQINARLTLPSRACLAALGLWSDPAPPPRPGGLASLLAPSVVLAPSVALCNLQRLTIDINDTTKVFDHLTGLCDLPATGITLRALALRGRPSYKRAGPSTSTSVQVLTIGRVLSWVAGIHTLSELTLAHCSLLCETDPAALDIGLSEAEAEAVAASPLALVTSRLQLRSLELENCFHAPRSAFEAASPKERQRPSSLGFGIDDAGIAAALGAAPQLEALTLVDMGALRGHFFDSCPGLDLLQQLTVRGCPLLEGLPLLHITAALSPYDSDKCEVLCCTAPFARLRSLTFASGSSGSKAVRLCEEATAEVHGDAVPAEAQARLLALLRRLRGAGVIDLLHSPLRRHCAPRLAHLDISGITFTERSADAVAGFAALVATCGAMLPPVEAGDPPHPTLCLGAINGTSLRGQAAFVSGLPPLESLSVDGNGGGSQTAPHIVAMGVLAERAARLRVLTLRQITVASIWDALCSDMVHLEHLDLTGCPDITAAIIEPLRQCAALRTLVLADVDATGNRATLLRTVGAVLGQTLTTLVVDRCPWVGLGGFGGFLGIEGPSLMLTDHCPPTRVPALTALSCRGCRMLMDTDLRFVAQFVHLTSLDLTDCHYTPEALTLERALPKAFDLRLPAVSTAAFDVRPPCVI